MRRANSSILKCHQYYIGVQNIRQTSNAIAQSDRWNEMNYVKKEKFNAKQIITNRTNMKSQYKIALTHTPIRIRGMDTNKCAKVATVSNTVLQCEKEKNV